MSAATVATLQTLAELEATICDAYKAETWPDVVERARHVGRKEAFAEAARIVQGPQPHSAVTSPTSRQPRALAPVPDHSTHPSPSQEESSP